MEVELKQVQVELKMTKITKTILNQSAWVSYEKLNGYVILGWCLVGNQKIVISYNSDTNVLVKSKYYYNIEESQINYDNVQTILLKMGHEYYFDTDVQKDFIGKYLVKMIWCNEKENERGQILFDEMKEKDEYLDVLRRYMKKVNELGKFYI